MSLPNLKGFGIIDNPLKDSPFFITINSTSEPETPGDFELLNGTNFLLLDNTNFLLLGS